MKKSAAETRSKPDRKSPEPLGDSKGASAEAGRRWASWRQWVRALVPAGCVLILDQLSKALVSAHIGVAEKLWLINPYLYLTHAQNDRGIFSLSFGPRFLYVILPLFAVGFVTYLLLRPQRRFPTFLMGLIVGGGLGNFIDRVRLGYVVDWISMWFPPLRVRWATYNVADAAIVVSVILLLIYEFFFSKPRKSAREPTEDSQTPPTT